MLRLADHERPAHADDTLRFAEDPLHTPRVALVARDLDRPRRRLDIVKANDAPFDLGDRLLHDDDDVAVLELDALDDHRSEIVPLAQLGNARERKDGEPAQCRPVTRRPACAR